MKVLGLAPEEITEQLRKGNVTLCIVGLGYVGLPLAILFAIEGARVIGCDKRREIVRRIAKGDILLKEHDIQGLESKGACMLQSNCPNCGVRLIEYHAETFCPACARRATVREGGVQLLTDVSDAYSLIASDRTPISEGLRRAIDSGRLQVTTDTTRAVRESDVVLICVGTPLGEDSKPSYGDLRRTCMQIGRGLGKGDLVILKSTVSPGTTENMVGPIIEKESRLKSGLDFGLANSPERIKEGYALFEFRTVPRNVAGINRESGEAAAAIFRIFPAQVHVFESPRITETAKLFENVYRDVNIALANELALICEKLHVDVIGAIEAARTDPKTNLLLPGPGVGGYCLPKDPYYLLSPAEDAGFRSKLIVAARRVNDSMPFRVLELVKDSFREMHKQMKGHNISILGLAFKGNSSDIRNTPSRTIAIELSKLGASIRVHDPHVDFEEAKRSLGKNQIEYCRDVWESIQDASCLIIATDHLEYRRLQLSQISSLMAKPGALVDARHIFRPEDVVESGLIYRGVGRRLES